MDDSFIKKTGFLDLNVTESAFAKELQKHLDEMAKTVAALRDAELVQICEENDFMVNNMRLKLELQKFLPEDAKIWVDKYIDPNCVLIIKKAYLHPEFQHIHFDDSQ